MARTWDRTWTSSRCWAVHPSTRSVAVRAAPTTCDSMMSGASPTDLSGKGLMRRGARFQARGRHHGGLLAAGTGETRPSPSADDMRTGERLPVGPPSPVAVFMQATTIGVHLARKAQVMNRGEVSEQFVEEIPNIRQHWLLVTAESGVPLRQRRGALDCQSNRVRLTTPKRGGGAVARRSHMLELGLEARLKVPSRSGRGEKSARVRGVTVRGSE